LVTRAKQDEGQLFRLLKEHMALQDALLTEILHGQECEDLAQEHDKRVRAPTGA
jgi:hypothetical protein